MLRRSFNANYLCGAAFFVDSSAHYSSLMRFIIAAAAAAAAAVAASRRRRDEEKKKERAGAKPLAQRGHSLFLHYPFGGISVSLGVPEIIIRNKKIIRPRMNHSPVKTVDINIEDFDKDNREPNRTVLNRV